jgi:hypothetical protein
MRKLNAIAAGIALAILSGCGEKSDPLTPGTRAVVHYKEGGWGASQMGSSWIERNGAEVIVLENGGKPMIWCKMMTGPEAGGKVPFAVEDLVPIR